MSTILCVEDEESLRRDLVEELTEAGYTVIQAQDGEEALALIIKTPPDLILSDLLMPRLDGLELLRQVREKVLVGAHIPFIFLSAQSAREQIISGLDEGGDDYLIKPVDFGLLLAKIKAALRQSQRVQKSITDDRVKIYKALSGADRNCDEGSRTTAAPETCRKTVALIGKRSEHISTAHRVLQALGHQVLLFRSGKVFLEKAEDLEVDSIIVDFYTDDFQAPILCKLLSAHCQNWVPVMLLWPQSLGQPPEDGNLDYFETVLSVPPSPSAEWLQAALRTLLDDQGSAQPAVDAPLQQSAT